MLVVEEVAMETMHAQRVKQELKAAGITGYALRKAEGRYLPELIRADEHIMAAVYGRTDMGSAMLVATDRRILYVDKKPLIAVSDEISYEVVGGVGVSKEAGLFVSVVLHTRMGDYSVRFVNPTSARKFSQYLGKVRLEGSPQPDNRRTKPVGQTKPSNANHIIVDDKTATFIYAHNIGVLSTLDRQNQLHGSVVYYVFDKSVPAFYILTKTETRKAHNILATHQVALTVYDEPNRQSLQVQGLAEIEADATTKQYVFDTISQPKQYSSGSAYPPVTHIKEGGYIIFRINPTHLNLNTYTHKEA